MDCGAALVERIITLIIAEDMDLVDGAIDVSLFLSFCKASKAKEYGSINRLLHQEGGATGQV